MDIMRQAACLVVNLITLYSYGVFSYCSTVGHKNRLQDGYHATVFMPGCKSNSGL